MGLGGSIGVVAGSSVPLLLSLFALIGKGQKPNQKRGAFIFPKSWGVRLFGFVCTAIFLWASAASPPRQMSNQIIWALIAVVFTAGVPIFCFGDVRLYDDRIEKRMLWMRTRIPWNEVDALVKDPRGECLLHGTQAQFKFNQYYVAYDRLITEIERRAPKLRWMLATPPNHLPWEQS